MTEHVILVLTRHSRGWRGHVRDFPEIQVEGVSAEQVYSEAALAIRREILKARLAGRPLPRLHSYAEVRIDDTWLRERGIRWSSALVRMITLPPRLETVSSAEAGTEVAAADAEDSAVLAVPVPPVLPAA